MSEVIAILCSDIHLSHFAPVARAAEPNWYAAMERNLQQLKNLQMEFENPPIICAGDVFHQAGHPPRYGTPPELINWAMDFLPKMWSVPGQHDLPYHNYNKLHESAYWSLVKAGRIRTMEHGSIYTVSPEGPLRIYPFPYGFTPQACRELVAGGVHLAVAHRYLWTGDTGYPGAPEDRHLTGEPPAWSNGYDAMLFGDNHAYFRRGRLFNPGCLIPRRSDERYYTPTVGLLSCSGAITPYKLSTVQDRWSDETIPKSEPESSNFDFSGFMDRLAQMSRASLDYAEAVHHYIETEGPPPFVRDTILEALDDKR